MLLSMVPEIKDYYELVAEKPSRAHPLDVSIVHDNVNLKYRFQIGDGVSSPPSEGIEPCFPGCEVADRYGKKEVDVLVSEVDKIKALIYTDARGQFWFIENPIFPIVMPEICLHFLISNIFSSIMRYSPDKWGGILLNDVDTDASLIIRKYLSALEAKMPMLALRTISRYYPYISQGVRYSR